MPSPAVAQEFAVLTQISTDVLHTEPEGHALPPLHDAPHTPAARHTVLGYVAVQASAAPVPVQVIVQRPRSSGFGPS